MKQDQSPPIKDPPKPMKLKEKMKFKSNNKTNKSVVRYL